MEAIETIGYRGFNINVYRDDISPSDNGPRDWDNLGTMACWHNGYNLGDEQLKESNEDYFKGLIDEFVPFDTDELSMDTVWKVVNKYFIILPLYLYDHSGITMNTGGFSCQWDSGQVGWIYISKSKVRDEYSCKRVGKKMVKRIAGYLENEVKTYDDFLRGDVYGYTIEPKDTNKNIECDDSCWGFYPEHNENGRYHGFESELKYMIDEAKSHIDYAIKDYKKR